MLLQVWPWVLGGWIAGWMVGKITTELAGRARLLDNVWVRACTVSGAVLPLAVASMSLWSPVVLGVLVLVLRWAWNEGWEELAYMDRLQDFNNRYNRWWRETEPASHRRVPHMGLPAQYRRSR